MDDTFFTTFRSMHGQSLQDRARQNSVFKRSFFIGSHFPLDGQQLGILGPTRIRHHRLKGRAYTQKLLRTEAFTHRGFYTQTPLHTDAFTHRRFYIQTLLHTDPFTHRSFYTQTLSHTETGPVTSQFYFSF